MNSKLREKAAELRLKEELSYGEIKKRLGVPKSTLSYWLRDFPLSDKKILELRRKGWAKGETSREKFRATMRKKRELENREIYNKYRKEFLKIPKKALFIIGLVLYLCEGNKKDYTRIALSNTDPKVIKFFIWWIKKFMDVSEDKIRAALHLYENMDIEKEQKFWKNELGLRKDQFVKPSIRKLQKSSFSYRESFRHGTCSLYLDSAQKKRGVMMAIQAFLDNHMLLRDK